MEIILKREDNQANKVGVGEDAVVEEEKTG